MIYRKRLTKRSTKSYQTMSANARAVPGRSSLERYEIKKVFRNYAQKTNTEWERRFSFVDVSTESFFHYNKIECFL